MLLRAVFIGVIFWISHSLDGQCSLKNFEGKASPCDQHGYFFVTLHFDHSSTGQLFVVSGNGKNYGYFEYSSLPIKLGPFKADCVTAYEFTIRDSVAQSCVLYKNMGKFCCPDLCKIQISNAELSMCKDLNFDLNFSFQSNAQENLFDVYFDNKFNETYSKTNHPITIKNLKASSINTFHSLSICAQNDKVCCDTVLLSNPCICNITRVRTDVIACHQQNKTFSVMINFDHKVASDSFRVGGNATNYGIFAYKDLPITIQNLPMLPNKSYEFLIVDQLDPFCFGVTVLGVIDSCRSNCKIGNITTAPLFCNDSTVMIALGLKATFPGVADFNIVVDAGKPNQLRYEDDVHLVLIPKKICGQNFTLRISDNLKPTCTSTIELKTDSCCFIPCTLKEVVVSEHCDDDGLQFLNVNFSYQGVSDSFMITLNDTMTWTFSYSALPIQLYGIGVLGSSLVIKIHDQHSRDCTILFNYTVQCKKRPPCKISNFDVVIMPCDSSKHYNAGISFDIENPRSDHFLLRINDGHPDIFDYDSIRFITKLLLGDCKILHRFIIRDQIDTSCYATFEELTPVCCKHCKISNPEMEYQTCIDGKYGVKINFDHVDTQQSFVLSITGKPDTMIHYESLPLVINHLEVNHPYFITIRDSLSETCTISFGPISKDCPSGIEQISIDPMLFFDGHHLIVESMAINPAHSHLHIYDINGKLLLKESFVERIEMDISYWPTGVYVCQIYLNQNIATKKIVKY